MQEESINIYGAEENNLKRLSLRIPKKKITVVTGVSGSGKSSLCLDTIAAVSRKELNETFPAYAQRYLPKYGRPHVERIENLPVAIVIDQKKPASNIRSTVGTYTDIYALLRLLFSRVGKPFAGYSDVFSFNHPTGRCPECEGLGEIKELDVHKLVDFDKSLNEEGCIHYIAFNPGGWRWISYACSGLFDCDKKIRDYTPEELELFLYSPQIKLENPPTSWPKTAKYEGLMTRMYRSVVKSEDGRRHWKLLEPMVNTKECPLCHGKRLSQKVLSCKIMEQDISDVSKMAIPDLRAWVSNMKEPVAKDIVTRLDRMLSAMMEIGLEYISLNRPMDSLSGGEVQRCKIAKYINSTLSDLLYVIDEPSVGLHSHDIHLLKKSIRRLCDRGNTILLVEHHREMIQMADHIVDMGPGAGSSGGEILFEGTYKQLLESGTKTGELLKESTAIREKTRKPLGWLQVEHANYHNLKNICVSFPLGVMTVIAGVAGSGKSSLMDCLRKNYPEDVIYISQKNIGVNLRSTPATYLKIADNIRKIFAKQTGQSPSLFSFNGEGACPVCHGTGVVISEMAFMDKVESVCEACGGLRYSKEALSHKVNGYHIAQVMNLTAQEAHALFDGTVVAERLEILNQVGLGYLHLNQALSTMSGGELQRLKLAAHLKETGKIFILDEPTDGLHMQDIRQLIKLMDFMTDEGNTVMLVEHNLDVLKAADYVIELGPQGGSLGGYLLYSGKVSGLLDCEESVTAPYLREQNS